MNNIIDAVLVLGILGAVLGLILAIAAKAFAVQEDERLEPVTEALPGANCGSCGYSGCAAYAKAIVSGEAKIGLCVPGGEAAAESIAKIMGQDTVAVEKEVAFVRCTGTTCKRKARYDGITDCSAAAKIAGGGDKACSYGCLGYGDCVKACQYDAIHIVDGISKVDRNKCTGCMLCAKACPKGLIESVPYKNQVFVPCFSKDKGGEVRKICSEGCIGCKMCEKACHFDAIHVDNNLAHIDYSKCVGCGACALKCPQKLIVNFRAKKAEEKVSA